MTRAIHGINLLLAFLLVAFSIAAWEHLPDRVPAHLDAGGNPTRWADRSFWSWFLLPAIGIATAALNYGLAALIPRKPKWINMPNKKDFLALPPDARQPVVRLMQQMLYATAIPLLIIFCLVQLDIWLAAHGREGTGLTVLVLVMAFAMTPFILLGWLPRIQNALNEAVRRRRDQQTVD